jgi:TRAP-type C4-dicarboxylate transport system permease small subunit
MKKRFTYIGLGLAVLLLMAVPAFSQSCALCYTQAASAGSRMIQALKSGILVLIVPPTLGSIGMIFVVYKKRNQVRRTDHDELDDEHDHEHADENFVRNDDESAQD